MYVFLVVCPWLEQAYLVQTNRHDSALKDTSNPSLDSSSLDDEVFLIS